MSRRRRFLLAWLALLALSYLVRAFQEREVELGPGERALELPAVDGGRTLDETVQLVWREHPGDGPTVLLLHGSPGSSRDFHEVARLLPLGWRLVAPDLPGFGKSALDVPDYSIAAHARYALELLDALGIERAHVVGYSMGGGVALELIELAPERVESLAMLSAIGVEELELFGDQRLNHLVHALQLGAIRFVRYAVPHFGLMDGAFLGEPYARNFTDTDQRPLRGVLERLELPVLVLHGEGDFLVPPAAAREHHRIVPQSELAFVPGGHFSLWTNPGEVAGELTRFVESVERGEAPTRAEAAPARAMLAEVPFDPRTVPPASGPALLLLMLFIVAGTLISEDLTCVGAGLLVAQGRMALGPAVTACFAGIYMGDLLLFIAGRYVGRPALKYPPLRWVVTEHRLEAAGQWFQRKGLKAIFITRLLPGLRLPIYFSAGLLHTRFVVFALYFFVAAAVWTPLLVGFSAWAGLEADRALSLFERFSLPVFLAFVAAILFVERVLVRLLTHRGRRLLVGSWRRKRHWEFWPPWAFYPPVVLYVLWLALKHKSFTVVTAVNPGIPTGGFIGESKSAILAQLSGTPERVAAHELLSAAEPEPRRVERARAFVRERGFPVVLKPDVGQRGSGVHVVEDEPALLALLGSSPFDLVLQEYVPGRELGVFYVRRPGEERGRIFSITEKRIPELVGDGRRTVEELILDDPRAVCMASTYFLELSRRLMEVPASAERVPLVRVGTHCRGAVFLDGAEHATPELEAEIERVSRGFEGFHFGRYDLRAESVEALRAGRFRVLELNGLTSEATHIYDPRHGLLYAYRVLFEQWRLAFEIGAANAAAGAPTSSIGELWREWRAYRRAQRGHLRPGAAPREEASGSLGEPA